MEHGELTMTNEWIWNYHGFSDKFKCLMLIDVGVSTKGLSFVVENHVKICGSQMGSILAAFE